jgi:hypothetical protein
MDHKEIGCNGVNFVLLTYMDHKEIGCNGVNFVPLFLRMLSNWLL